jgi:hypothetical protein
MSGDHNMNQKPVAWFHEEKYKTHFTTNPSEDMIGKYWQPLYTAPLTVSMQEPVGEVLNERGEVDYISYIPPVGTPLYTAQRQRVTFPTMLRKMWSGREVQAWLDENVNKEKNT